MSAARSVQRYLSAQQRPGATMRIEVIASSVLALFIAGCATSPTAPSDARPSSTVVYSEVARSNSGSGTLVVRRDRGILGIACGHTIRLDGKMIADLDAGQEVVVYPPPGEHIVEAWLSGVWCSAGSGGGVAIQSEPGKRILVRTGMAAPFGVVLTASTEASSPVPPTARPALAAPPSAPAANTIPATPVADIGNDSWAAERLSAVKACHPAPKAKLSAKGPGFETYTVGCSIGDVLLVRCEMGNCRVMR